MNVPEWLNSIIRVIFIVSAVIISLIFLSAIQSDLSLLSSAATIFQQIGVGVNCIFYTLVLIWITSIALVFKSGANSEMIKRQDRIINLLEAVYDSGYRGAEHLEVFEKIMKEDKPLLNLPVKNKQLALNQNLVESFCPHCNSNFKTERSDLGKTASCPECGASFKL